MTLGARTLLLLVEDNPDDELLALRALRKGGFDPEVVVVRDGVEALEWLAVPGEQGGQGRALPGLVLLDLKLPRIDGLEVLRRLRAEPRTRTLPIVLLTSSRQPEDVARAYELGANGYVCKPVESEAFFEAVRTIGAYWLKLNEPPPTAA
jgi:two-component system, response regulator